MAFPVSEPPDSWTDPAADPPEKSKDANAAVGVRLRSAGPEHEGDRAAAVPPVPGGGVQIANIAPGHAGLWMNDPTWNLSATVTMKADAWRGPEPKFVTCQCFWASHTDAFTKLDD